MKQAWKVFGKTAAICLAFGIVGAVGIYQYKQEKLAEDIASKVIRFHVLANSDSESDQQLKLQVRDAIGAYMGQELKGAQNIWDGRRIVLADMENIEKTAQAVVESCGYSYGVTASLAQVEFPRKTYGEYTFPAGEYEALQVVIGEGNGKNWWCVMYPNLCFFNSVYEVVEEEAQESLKKVLTTEEYSSIMENGSYKVKFKWLSFLDK